VTKVGIDEEILVRRDDLISGDASEARNVGSSEAALPPPQPTPEQRGKRSGVLWIAGHGPLHDEVEAMAGRQRALRLLPYETDRAEVARMLASADLYITGGPHETFALSVIESRACGLPVVGGDAGALREWVPEGLGHPGPCRRCTCLRGQHRPGSR
jgi:glycosyltransferase involved in cell wall biosynthesis